ncbi:MAG: Flp family type IVb pilin [Hoeflea sp.]|uniref:Flp family type IVb pilin n=1 Tax=Hoeflea sp. TaxID=1940281 RepID=UPI000C1142A2|nr:Flp family type IVb pilin [Hoeflea sp.]PHR22312.1 MAG: Flp family type IVb pilin [Hoeflea sp.]
MKSLLYRFIEDRSGATAIEYGIMAALIVTALISGATVLGEALNNSMSNTANRVKDSM